MANLNNHEVFCLVTLPMTAMRMASKIYKFTGNIIVLKTGFWPIGYTMTYVLHTM